MKNQLIKKYIEHGLDSIDENLTTEIKVKDLAFIYKTVQELITFFHQKAHYEELDDVKNFMGDKDDGMFSILCDICYKKLEKGIDPSIKEILDDDSLVYPEQQYYKSNNKNNLS